MINSISDIIEQQKTGKIVGITSICSSNPYVIEAALIRTRNHNNVVLIESTSNQVDQFGGYTGMTPTDFVKFIYELAQKCNYPKDKIILGGDHLGPNVWQHEPPELALKKAKDQIKTYVEAGYSKIHLDASMPLKGDPTDHKGALPLELSALRTAELCAVAEETFNKSNNSDRQLSYIIGTDVPIPGGAHHSLKDIVPTKVGEVKNTIQLTQKSFEELGLLEAWNRVIAVVVQPGVDFSQDSILEYNRQKTASLTSLIESKDNLVYEAHSTDYQKGNSLREMVEDHYAILKVGPWLTFAYREAVIALTRVEHEFLSQRKDVILSDLQKTINLEMDNFPKYWQKHYKGSKGEINLSKIYSYSDRVRYYWPFENIQKGLNRLIQNLTENPIPLTLISQYLSGQYWKIRNSELSLNPVRIIHDNISKVLEIYDYATRLSENY